MTILTPATGSGSLNVVARALSVPIRAYQAVRAGRPSPCRYWPTCSTYALEALEAHGPVRGSWLAARRLLRCHPWASRSGVDLVPTPGASS
jgi:uncharacterized protein